MFAVVILTQSQSVVRSVRFGLTNPGYSESTRQAAPTAITTVAIPIICSQSYRAIIANVDLVRTAGLIQIKLKSLWPPIGSDKIRI